MTTTMITMITMTLTVLAAGGIDEAAATAAIKAAIGDKVADIFVNIIVAGVKSGAVKPEVAAKQLAEMSTAAEETAAEETAAEAAKEKKAKMTAEESDAAAASADHIVALWYPKNAKSGKAIYRIDNGEPVVFNFSEPREISDTVIEVVKGLDGSIACNNPFVIKSLGENKGVFAANSKGSKMLKAVKTLGDLMAAGGTADSGSGAGSGAGQATAPTGA